MVNYVIYVTKEAIEKLQDLQLKANDVEYEEEKKIVEYMLEVMLNGSLMPPNIFKCTCGKVCTTKHGLREHIYAMHIFQHKDILENKRTIKVVNTLDGIKY